MKHYKEFLEHLASERELDSEVMPGQSLVEIYGSQRVLIEHHMGVMQYCTGEICVKVRNGTICVAGSNLELVRMTHEQLVIIGNICTVSIRDRRH